MRLSIQFSINFYLSAQGRFCVKLILGASQKLLRRTQALQTNCGQLESFKKLQKLKRREPRYKNVDRDIKNVNSSAVFRKKIKEWNGDKCNCKICR